MDNTKTIKINTSPEFKINISSLDTDKEKSSALLDIINILKKFEGLVFNYKDENIYISIVRKEDNIDTRDKLIVEQQLEIKQLKQQLLIKTEKISDIYLILYRIGGPLNDNRQGLSPDQLRDFIKIADIIRG